MANAWLVNGKRFWPASPALDNTRLNSHVWLRVSDVCNSNHAASEVAWRKSDWGKSTGRDRMGCTACTYWILSRTVEARLNANIFTKKKKLQTSHDHNSERCHLSFHLQPNPSISPGLLNLLNIKVATTLSHPIQKWNSNLSYKVKEVYLQSVGRCSSPSLVSF